MSFWRLFYHLVWATKYREPIIDDQVEDLIVRSMQSICMEEGIIVHAFGVMPDHMHAALSIPPRLAISQVVQELKGKTTHRLNDALFRARGEEFGWQAEYGVLSVGDRSLDRVRSYVLNQREHHANGSLWPIFETDDRRIAASIEEGNASAIDQP